MSDRLKPVTNQHTSKRFLRRDNYSLVHVFDLTPEVKAIQEAEKEKDEDFTDPKLSH